MKKKRKMASIAVVLVLIIIVATTNDIVVMMLFADNNYVCQTNSFRDRIIPCARPWTRSKRHQKGCHFKH